MKTLSLGVLIVCGGTLAALPFRRYQAIPDASTVPTQVTGPSESALDVSSADHSHSNAERVPTLAEIDRFDQPGRLYESSTLVSRSPASRRRHVDIPLTYEDLEVPIDQPKPVLERFSATAAARQQHLQEERIAELVMPPMESLALDQQQDLMRVAESFAPSEGSNQGRAGGRLASSTSSNRPDRVGDSVLETLPTTQVEPQRQRFWIRQPQ